MSEEGATETPAPRWRRITAFALAGLAGLALLALDTAPGRGWAARQLAQTTFANGLRIEIAQIDGSLYGSAKVRGLRLFDPKGEFLRADQAELDWRPFAWLSGHVDIRRLNAPLVVLERAPQLRDTNPGGPLLPDIDITIADLHIARLVALPAVSGTRRELRVAGQARIADRRAQVTLQAATLAAPGGQAGDRIDLKLDAVPEANRLALTLALDAPTGGVIAALGGLREGLALRLAGAGDWRAWNGTLSARLGGKPLAALQLTARDGLLAAKGPAELGRLLNGVPARLLGPSTRLALSARVDRRRAAIDGSLRSDALALSASGMADFGRDRFDGLRIEAMLLQPGALAPGLSARGLRAEAVLSGAMARPAIRYQLAAAALALNDITLEGLSASGEARVEDHQTVVPLKAAIARISGIDAAAGGTLTAVGISGDLHISGSRILSDNLALRSDRIDATLIAAGDMARGAYSGALDGRIASYKIDSVGTFALGTTARLTQEARGLTLAGTIRARSTEIASPGLRDLLGGSVTGSGDLAYGPDGVIRFSRLRASAPLLQVLDGHGSYVPGGALALSASGHSARYGPLGLELTGTAAAPRAVVTAARPGLGLGLAQLRAEVISAEGGYHLAATGQTDYGPLTADVTVMQGTGPLALNVNRGDLAGIGFTGRLVRSPAGPFAGELAANGEGLGGIIRLEPLGREQQLLIKARANAMVLPGPARLAIGSAIVEARAVLADHPTVVADVQLADAKLRGIDFAVARALVDYRDGRGQAKVLAEGISGAPFRIAANAAFAPDLWRVAVDGRVRGVAVRTASPARIVPSAKGYELLPTQVDLGGGSLRLAGHYGADLRLETRLESFDLALLNTFTPGYGLGGHATGSIDFTQDGADAFPRAEARLAIDGFTRTTAISVSQPVDVNATATLAADAAALRAVLRRRGTVIGRLQADLHPLGAGAGDWQARLRAGTLGGGVRYNGPADTLWSFAGQSNQSLTGSLALGADFSGRLQQPQLSGIVRGDSLTYENQSYGTRLTGASLSGHFSGDQLQIEQFTASAGSGKITGRGYIGLASESGYPMDLALDLDNARLARSNALSSAATGAVRLTKAAGQPALLSGTLSLPETRYELVRQGAAQVPELTGVRMAPSRGRTRIAGDEPPAPRGSIFDDLRLDVALKAGNQLFVTGMGLDSEWSAQLRVSGTGSHPRLSGDVNLVRGNLSFAGRQFELQEGRLLFTGGEVADPQIALSASEDIEDISVSVNVSGRSLNPQISFTSSPALPADEILSRILFGNSVGQLSPLQGLQLAASLNSLRASGGGLNPLGKLRAATGVSRLRILAPDEKTNRGTALAAGRYITNNIYLELITDARGFTATQIEVSLSRTLSILSQAGGAGQSNFDLRYKKRY